MLSSLDLDFRQVDNISTQILNLCLNKQTFTTQIKRDNEVGKLIFCVIYVLKADQVNRLILISIVKQGTSPYSIAITLADKQVIQTSHTIQKGSNLYGLST